jgi:hypothetical protein
MARGKETKKLSNRIMPLTLKKSFVPNNPLSYEKKDVI